RLGSASAEAPLSDSAEYSDLRERGVGARFPSRLPPNQQCQPPASEFLRYFLKTPHGGTLNDYLLSVVLGIIEGLTEFLPVSSTAHLRISEALFHISLSNGYWKMYTIVIQFGAILCLPVYFRARIAKFLSTFPQGERGDRTVFTHPLSLTLIAFVVTAIPAFLLTKVVGKHLESLQIMGTSLLVGGIVMWIVDAMNAKSEAAGPDAPYSRIHIWKMEAMSLGQAVWIGACQILSAVFPGTSRSMSTI